MVEFGPYKATTSVEMYMRGIKNSIISIIESSAISFSLCLREELFYLIEEIPVFNLELILLLLAP